MKKVGFIGWRGMVGSVLLQRMNEEKDFDGSFEAVYFSTSQTGQKGQRTRGPQKLKFTYQEQKDYETIEADIAALEEKIGKLDEEMAAVSTNFVKLNQLTAEKEETEKLLEEKMDRWMYLEELAARIVEQ